MTFLCSNLHIALLQLKSSLLYFRVLFVAVAKTGGSDDDGSNCCNLVMLRWPIFNPQLAREDSRLKFILLFFNGISRLKLGPEIPLKKSSTSSACTLDFWLYEPLHIGPFWCKNQPSAHCVLSFTISARNLLPWRKKPLKTASVLIYIPVHHLHPWVTFIGPRGV